MLFHPLGNTGLSVSVLGYGASPLGSVFRPIDEAEGVRAVRLALDLGINFLDVSPYYGLTRAETVLGRALQGVTRDRYYLATKVGRYGEDSFDFSAERVTRSVDESLARLGVDYVDLIQCHDVEFGSLDQVVEETLPALERVREQGKARFIGITGLPLHIFPYVLGRSSKTGERATPGSGPEHLNTRTPEHHPDSDPATLIPHPSSLIDTVLSYCHYCLNDTSLEELIPLLERFGVGIINAAPLSMGLLTSQGPPPWHPAPPELRDACARAAALCRERGADIAKLALQFTVRNPHIATTLVGMADPKEVRQNVKWIEEPLDESLLQDVLALLAPVHNITWPSGNDPATPASSLNA